MHRRQYIATAMVVGSALVAGCTGRGGGSAADENDGGATPTTSTVATPTSTQAKAETTIDMKNTAFTPLKADINVGTPVKWVNKDGFQHDVTSAQFSDHATTWNFAKTLASGESITYTFDTEGVYQYYCTIHGKNTMCGAVLAGDVALENDLPCESGDGYSY